MKRLLALLCAAILLGRLPVGGLMAQGREDQSTTPTFRATSTLVFLDVTVLDKKGRPVVKGLTKDDFTITEDNKSQRIFSFEAPETHVMATDAEDVNPEGKAPLTIFVLDLLNSSFEDFAYIRYEVRQFLMAQPPQLASPAELMVIGNHLLTCCKAIPEAERTCCTRWIICRPCCPSRRCGVPSTGSGLRNRSMHCSKLHFRTRACQDGKTSCGLVTAALVSVSAWRKEPRESSRGVEAICAFDHQHVGGRTNQPVCDLSGTAG